eukprot:Em0006g387a
MWINTFRQLPGIENVEPKKQLRQDRHKQRRYSIFVRGVFLSAGETMFQDAQALQSGRPGNSGAAPFTCTEEQTAWLSEFLSREKDSPSTPASSKQTTPSVTS